jgi:hypothetical protein
VLSLLLSTSGSPCARPICEGLIKVPYPEPVVDVRCERSGPPVRVNEL